MSHHSTVDRPGKGKARIESLTDYVVVDLETTGFSPADCGITELGAVRVRDGQITAEFSSLVNSGCEIPDNVTAITGITNEMVQSAPPLDCVLPGFLDFIGDDVIVGHNIAFDINFLYDAALLLDGRTVSNDYINTVTLARSVYPELSNHKLQTLQKHCGLTNDCAHRALSDVRCTQQLYELLRRNIRFGMVLPAANAFGGYEPLDIFNAILTMTDDSGEYVKLKMTKNGASIYMFGSVAFSVRVNSRTQCLDTDEQAAFEYITLIEGAWESGGKAHFPLAARTADSDAIKDMVCAVYAARQASVYGRPFLCCNDFMRCSDAKQCLKSGNPEYNGCAYRKNLEAGRIFYGKNRNVEPLVIES